MITADKVVFAAFHGGIDRQLVVIRGGSVQIETAMKLPRHVGGHWLSAEQVIRGVCISQEIERLFFTVV